jgi:hypothetical protein
MKSLQQLVQSIKEAKLEPGGPDIGKLFGPKGKYSPKAKDAPKEKETKSDIDILRGKLYRLGGEMRKKKKENDGEMLNERIVKRDDSYAVVSKKGKNLGTYPSRKQAVKRLRQVEYFKHLKEQFRRESQN